MKTTQEIKTDFEQILSDVSGISGITSDSATQVAQVILQEFGRQIDDVGMNGCSVDGVAWGVVEGT